jgi:hypothetical protein
MTSQHTHPSSPLAHVRVATRLLERGRKADAEKILGLLAVAPPSSKPRSAEVAPAPTSDVRVDPALGKQMLEWHRNPNDPIYRAGTLVRDEQPVERDLLTDAVESLEMVRLQGGLSPQDGAALGALVVSLDAHIFGRRVV